MTSPQQYTPRDPNVLDSIGYTQRVVDAILRNNPLTDAVVSEGLIRWIGHYTDAGDPNLINFLWIGEFFPADINISPDTPQRGFSLVRDDSRGGVSAIAMYDPSPGSSAGLKQVLIFTSGDNHRLFEESRDGGQKWPEDNIWMGELGSDTTQWTGTTSGTFDSIYEGRVNVVGNRVAYRVFCATTGGASGEFRLRVEGIGGDVSGTTHVLGVNANAVFDSFVDVSASRGNTVVIRWEGRVTNAVGVARARVISCRCFTP